MTAKIFIHTTFMSNKDMLVKPLAPKDLWYLYRLKALPTNLEAKRMGKAAMLHSPQFGLPVIEQQTTSVFQVHQSLGEVFHQAEVFYKSLHIFQAFVGDQHQTGLKIMHVFQWHIWLTRIFFFLKFIFENRWLSKKSSGQRMVLNKFIVGNNKIRLM